MARDSAWKMFPVWGLDEQVMMGPPKKSEVSIEPLSEVQPQLLLNQMLVGVHG